MGLGASARSAKGSIVARRSVAPAAAGAMSQRRVVTGVAPRHCVANGFFHEVSFMSPLREHKRASAERTSSLNDAAGCEMMWATFQLGPMRRRAAQDGWVPHQEHFQTEKRQTRQNASSRRNREGSMLPPGRSKAPNSTSHQRRLPINLHSWTTEFPPTGGSPRPFPGAGVDAIAPWLARL